MAKKEDEKPKKTGAKSGAKGAAAGVSKSSYDASSITVLEGLDPVRKRPGMYIGTTGPDGLHHLVWEIFDNSRDEAMGGHANDIEIALLPGGYVRVVDNGRGIPVGIHPKTKVSALETIMTTLHAGGKFGGEDSGYKVSGGLHGVGASVVNALSEHAKVIVHKDGAVHLQEYKIGKALAKVKQVGKTTHTGSIVFFKPDVDIFKDGIEWNWDKIVSHVRQQAYLVKGTRITVIDAREAGTVDSEGVFYVRELGLEVPSMAFYFEGGLRSLVAFNNQHQTPVHKNIFYVEAEKDDVMVEVALQYVDDISPRLMAFANNTYNAEHGTHVTGFKTALTRTINTYGRTAKILKESEENFTGDDALEGITAVVSVKMPEIQFEGQTKAKLGSVEAQSAVASVFGEAFAMFLEENPDDARAIVNKVLLALKARKAAKAAKDSVMRKGALEGMTLPGKLADCQSKDPADSELFIVEGDSAGGCFSGDTKVALLDGRDLPFTELVQEHEAGKQNYCYTISSEGSVAAAPILHPRITKENAEVIDITLDTGEVITCTPDHRFMLRDGSYKEAGELLSTDSLMPLMNIDGRISKENSSIMSIAPRTGLIPVYDLEVEGTHNFALASGVFVHNSAKMGRERRTQAILPLRGKILNIERARLDKMLASEQIKNLVVALGTAIGDVFNIEKLRYHKIIIATDADVDGAHIRTLLLTLFYRHFRPVIDGGFIFIAQPPLYKLTRGKEVRYAYTDEEKFAIIGKEAIVTEDEPEDTDMEAAEAEENTEVTKAAKPAKWKQQRYKGLGEMNPDELFETTMDAKRRILKRVTVDDASEADRIFDILMGTDVASRKSFIQSNAKLANLDV